MRFIALIALVGAIGLAIALQADQGAGNRDAWRELGGAVLSGAVLAGLVVWFEQKREERREKRNVQREDEAAQRAWRREIDIRFVGTVRTDLALGRIQKLAEFERNANVIAEKAPRRKRTKPVHQIAITSVEVTALIAFLRDDNLQNKWNVWIGAFDDLQSVEPSERDETDIARTQRGQPLRDPQNHAWMAQAERAAWDRFTVAVNSYVDESYPLKAADASGGV